MSFLGSLTNKMNKGDQPPTTAELLKECHRIRKLATQNLTIIISLSIDRYEILHVR